MNVHTLVGELGGSLRRHRSAEFTQHAQNLAQIDFALATAKQLETAIPVSDSVN